MANSVPLKNRLNFYKRLLKKKKWLSFLRIEPEVILRSQCDPDSLRRAAQFFELDVMDPDDFTVLVNLLAEILFGDRPSGRKRGDKIWDTQKFYSLGMQSKILKSKNPGLTGTEIAELISQKGNGFSEYRNHPEELRKRLADGERYCDYCAAIDRNVEYEPDEKWLKRFMNGFAPRFTGPYIHAVATVGPKAKKFFLPPLAYDHGDPEVTYQRIKTNLEKDWGPLSETRYYSMEYVHNGKRRKATVGQDEHDIEETVIAIFATDSETFLVCTPGRGVYTDLPLLAENASTMVAFDPAPLPPQRRTEERPRYPQA
jgi:hypothetical protein